MTTMSIPISVDPRRQRTLTVVGFGVKALITAKVSGKLIIRKKRLVHEPHPNQKIAPWHETPPVPDPLRPRPIDNSEELGTPIPPMPTYFPEDHQQNLVSNGIKVRDFAYPVTRVGHRTPTHPHPMALTKEGEEKLGQEKAKDIPLSPEKGPMPSVSMEWAVPHPSLRPVAVLEGAPLKAPTPEAPYCPIYENHRIPVPFPVFNAVVQVNCRLAQKPRTVPIRGMITRRLLTLGPHLVDLSRYHEMDLEELRRYDRRIVWQLMHGIEPYPWYSDRDPAWTPTEANLRFALKQASQMDADDAHAQAMLLHYGWKVLQEDNAWQAERFAELRLANEQNGRVVGGAEEVFFPPYDQIMDGHGITLREYLELWERRMDSDRAVNFDKMFIKLKNMHAYDREQRLSAGTATNADMAPVPSRLANPYIWVRPPFILGQQVFELPRLPYWGPDAVWDGYRLHSGVPTGKTLNEYAAEFSRRIDGSPWPPAPSPSFKRKFEEIDEDGSETDSDESEPEKEAGPSQKRARSQGL
ncbi:hypothetical protein K438DRAFT_2012919 [Mycena galopus ATCC 62051]|nr:hypothetical protein K438DRAFT_2012919 [Mycena galopus ATCC 62051]